MSNLLKKRIGSLEKCLPDIEWPDVTIHLISTDGRLDPPDPQPDRLGMVVVSGTHHQGGQVFYRAEDETEEQFINRTQN